MSNQKIFPRARRGEEQVLEGSHFVFCAWNFLHTRCLCLPVPFDNAMPVFFLPLVALGHKTYFRGCFFRELGEKVQRLMCFRTQHIQNNKYERKAIVTVAYKNCMQVCGHQLGKLIFEPQSKSAFWGLQIKINRPALSFWKLGMGNGRHHKSGLTRLWLSFLSPLVGFVTRTSIRGLQHEQWKEPWLF